MKELTQRALGPVTVILLAVTVWLGIWVTPPDQVQHNLVRLLYIHPAIATVALYISFGTAVIASALYLWKRTRSMTMDRIAEAALEVSVVFIVLTMITGSILGRPTWGVWWAWDATLTTTAILGVLEVGCLALRRANDDPEVRARRSAALVLVSAIDVPVIHFSVDWWNTLHQGASVLTENGTLKVHGSMLWTMLLSFVAFSLAFCWLVRERYRVGVARDERERTRLEAVLRVRQTEGV
jgi:heme exporter protein C